MLSLMVRKVHLYSSTFITRVVIPRHGCCSECVLTVSHPASSHSAGMPLAVFPSCEKLQSKKDIQVGNYVSMDGVVSLSTVLEENIIILHIITGDQQL